MKPAVPLPKISDLSAITVDYEALSAAARVASDRLAAFKASAKAAAASYRAHEAAFSRCSATLAASFRQHQLEVSRLRAVCRSVDQSSPDLNRCAEVIRKVMVGLGRGFARLPDFSPVGSPPTPVLRSVRVDRCARAESRADAIESELIALYALLVEVVGYAGPDAFGEEDWARFVASYPAARQLFAATKFADPMGVPRPASPKVH